MSKIEKPWGYEEIIQSNDDYLFKRLFMKEGHRCSAQYHEHKTETVYVLMGTLMIDFCESGFDPHTVILYPGHHCTIPAGQKHRMFGQTDCFYLEASSPFPDDTIRIEDDYDRK